MNMSPPGWRRTLRGLPLALALSIAFLGVTAGQVFVEFTKLAPHWGELSASVDLRIWDTPLGGAAVFFVAALLLVHATLGIAVWLMALTTEKAFPDLPIGRRRLVTAWFAIAVLWILIGNASEYPWSRSGLHSGLLVEPVLGGARLFDFLTVLVLATIGWVGTRALLTFPRVRAVLPRSLAYGALVLMVLLTMRLVRASHSDDAGPGPDRPNLIVIGIDSVRSDAIGEGRGLGITPNIDLFLRDGAHLFSDAITPAARTYVSWMSILSGDNPRTHGARENLMPRAALAPLNTLPMRLRKAGYQSFYATDDVRFSNIDASYGFDRAVTPSIGATDFLLSKANDLPLSNLISNTRLSRWLFPATYSNRAAHHAYLPDTFIEWLEDEVEPATGPQFLAIHLTLPHWPYLWAVRDNLVFERGEDRQYRYVSSVIAADRQFGQLMALLESRGLLSNAIVVVLSDHGEGLGMPVTDALIRGPAAREALGPNIEIGLWGHGNSTLSPRQYSVLLAMRGYGKSAFRATARSHRTPASVIDVAPTLLDLANVPAGEPMDGVSLRPVIEGDQAAMTRLETRARFTETGFRTRMLETGNFDEHGLLETMGPFFRMDHATARFEVRTEMIPRLIADKERAAITARWLLSSIPTSLDGDTQHYVLFDRVKGTARRLTQPPDAGYDPEVIQLWNDLHSQYGDELLPPEP
jgi:arylsulfatase A-like enzyme